MRQGSNDIPLYFTLLLPNSRQLALSLSLSLPLLGPADNTLHGKHSQTRHKPVPTVIDHHGVWNGSQKEEEEEVQASEDRWRRDVDANSNDGSFGHLAAASITGRYVHRA